jgi:hypothetical protein
MTIKKNKDWSELDFFGDKANEETNLFNRKVSWNEEDPLDEKYIEFLAPHSRRYFSRLRPLFSFEIKNLRSLNGFSHILLRDGILFLLRFFQRFPEPTGFHSLLFIQEDMAFIVPEAWSSKVNLYKTVMYERKITSHPENLVLILNLHELQSPEILHKLIKDNSNGVKSLAILPFFNQMRGEDYLNYNRAENLNVLNELFSNNVDLINQADIGAFSESEYFFINGNPQMIYYSDSSLTHNFLRSGWTSPIYDTIPKGTDDVVSLSPYHGMSMSKYIVPSWQKPLRKRLFDDLNFPRGEFFTNEPALNRDVEDYFKIFYYSKDLLQLSYELGRELYSNKSGSGRAS